MSKTYRDSRLDNKNNRREQNTRKRFVKNKEEKRQQKFKRFISYEDDTNILLVHSNPDWYYEDDDWATK